MASFCGKSVKSVKWRSIQEVAMRVLRSTEVAKRFGAIQQIVQTEPVCVQSHGRPQVVMLSPAEYERLRRQDRRVYSTDALPPSLRAAIAKARPSRAAAAFDGEVG
jgi:prevent-host-death family protein